MEKIILNLRHLYTKMAIHTYLKEKLELPEYYGENLDALYDELSCICRDTCIGFFGVQDAAADIYDYQQSVKQVFLAADSSNPHLCVICADIQEV